ncbi:ATP synthase subunit I [Methylomarinum sp. Ch1-1]|uniref:ATP synthase subunit I n=1 Tax=Methylomarinum roseum TaxID=3067653 RepID=A0AAU7NX04_9GAMM|nr:ATP synthase subunit I [Methylomarinum sp. Ch1-1]MDP4522404.1 ATP synthase subunit I [Methylomarinum sp. Ch1-1]
MTESFYLYGAALLWGLLLGVFYFGGLWLTVRRLVEVKHQALWMLGSFLSRNLLAAAAFYPVALQGWQAMLFCLAGFIVVRMLLSRRIRVQDSH